MRARTHLLTEFLNGVFGDPALYVWEENGKDALLFDCGDLSQYSGRKLLKVSAIFLSHCHMDHIYGFDAFLRAHIGIDKTTLIFGPPETSARIHGKLQGYTWNLVENDFTQFLVVDLNVKQQTKTTTSFRAQNRFFASHSHTEFWDPHSPIYDTPSYSVRTVLLDHRTPSQAYSIEEKPSFSVNSEKISQLGLKTGAWIHTLKKAVLENQLSSFPIEVPFLNGTLQSFDASRLAQELLIRSTPKKIAYVTDGSASESNRLALLQLIKNADLMYSETCFLPEDQALATQTKHFTTQFIAEIAQEAHVQALAPFHFSKRYSEHPERLFQSISQHFRGEILSLWARKEIK